MEKHMSPGWGMQVDPGGREGSQLLEVEWSKMQPPNWLSVILPLSGAFSQTNILSYLDNQGIHHPHIYL